MIWSRAELLPFAECKTPRMGRFFISLDRFRFLRPVRWIFQRIILSMSGTPSGDRNTKHVFRIFTKRSSTERFLVEIGSALGTPSGGPIQKHVFPIFTKARPVISLGKLRFRKQNAALENQCGVLGMRDQPRAGTFSLVRIWAETSPGS